MRCFAKKPCTRRRMGRRVVMMKLPVITCPQLWSFSSYRIPQPAKNFDVLLLRYCLVVVNAMVTQHPRSFNGVCWATEVSHGSVAVHACEVQSSLSGCQVTSRPRDQFPQYSQWLDTFRTDLV
ncbi:hypothetical protein Hamer_G029663 [Homarus americanus]|uniref:Uncharacterized protein n=1 Tax=Homarus americanus TaxID=6706 RepID=A0A8J5J8X8_HOMAM|nr:hypothetical protein Hamer_G029663 [Homarus americanus]